MKYVLFEISFLSFKTPLNNNIYHETILKYLIINFKLLSIINFNIFKIYFDIWNGMYLRGTCFGNYIVSKIFTEFYVFVVLIFIDFKLNCWNRQLAFISPM